MKALALLIDPLLNRRGRSEFSSSSVLAYRAIVKLEDNVHSLVRWLNYRRGKRRAIIELRALTDNLLSDIGITRSDIEAVVDQRWTPVDGRGGEVATRLRPVWIGKLLKLPSSAANDDGMDSAA